MNTLYEYEKYCTDSENLRQTLDKYGVAIIPSILNDEECLQMQNNMWNFLEHITQKWDTPINRNKPETYINIYKLFMKKQVVNMLIKFWGIGHSQMAWDIRQNKKIVDVFAKFWNVDPEELLVSFDASSIHMPPEITNIISEQYKWYHTDQSYLTNDLIYLQSWVTAFDVLEGDGTLSILEGSHKHHEEFGYHFDISDPNDWYRLNENELQFYYNKGCVEKLIKCPKGSLIIWDGRTIHYGLEGTNNRLKPNIRCVSYICYLPRKLASEKDLMIKREAFNKMLTTTHNPYKINIIPKTIYPDMDENEYITSIDKPILSELGYKLAGF